MSFREVPIGAVFDVRNGATPSSGEPDYWGGEIPWISPTDLGKLKGRFIANGERSITMEGFESCGTQMVPEGAIILSTRAPIGHIAIASQSMCFNQGCRGLVPRNLVRSDFAYWAVSTCKPNLEAAGQGTTFVELSRSKLRAAHMLLPDLETQESIANFLDDETARIDQLIEKKKQLGKLLHEKRQAISAELVTKGFNKSVGLSSTGIGWLQEAPKHWRIRRIASIFYEADEPGEDDLPILSVSINWGISDRELGDEDRHRIVNHIKDKSSYKRVRPGDLVYNMMRAWQGAFGVTAIDGLVSPAYVVARPVETIHSPYFETLLRTPMCIEEFRRGSKGIADFRQRLYWEHFRQVRVVLPPLQEQKAIAQKIQTASAKIDKVLQPIKDSITLLQELRTALITAAVTGQIDVASWNKTAEVEQQLEVIEGGLTKKKTTSIISASSPALNVLVAAEIVRRHHSTQKFGRVKLQKILYLAETHAGIDELNGNYTREAAGPLDRELLQAVETGMADAQFYRTEANNGRDQVKYTPLPKAKSVSIMMKEKLGKQASKLSKLIDLLRDEKTKSVEAIATLYAVWNDALMDGGQLDDKQIIHAVLNDWHPEKQNKFSEEKLQRWLNWMRRKDLVPTGRGPKTSMGRLL